MNSCCEFRVRSPDPQTYATVYFRDNIPSYLILDNGNAYPLPIDSETGGEGEEALSEKIESGDIVFEIWCTSREGAESRLAWARDTRASITYYLFSQSPPPAPLIADWSGVKISRSNDPFPAELLKLLSRDPLVLPFLPETEYSGVYRAELKKMDGNIRSAASIAKNPAFPPQIRQYGQWIAENQSQSDDQIFTLYRSTRGAESAEPTLQLIESLLDHLFAAHGLVWTGKKMDTTPGHYPKLYDWSRAFHSASPAEWASHVSDQSTLASANPADLPRIVLASIKVRIRKILVN